MAGNAKTLRLASCFLFSAVAFFCIADFQSKVLVHKAAIAAEKQDWQATGEYAGRALRLNPSIGYAWYYRGVSRAAQDEFAAARGDLLKAVSLMNNPSLPRLTLSGVLYQAGEYAEAVGFLDQALSMNPHPELNPVRNWQRLADLYGKTGNPWAGIPALWMASLAGKMRSDTLLPIANQYRAIGHHSPGFPDLLAQYFAWSSKPDADLKAWIISFYDNADRPDLVAAYLQHLIDRNFHEKRDFLGLALACCEAGDGKKALIALENAGGEFAEEALYHYARGKASQLVGDHAAMATAFRRYLELAPNASDRAEIEAIIQKTPGG